MKKHLNNGRYNRIDREVITNPNLSLKAKGLLTLIIGFPDDWDFTITGLMQFVMEGREAILSALRELIEKGYATRTSKRDGNGRFEKYDYSFFESPLSAIPTTEKPLPETRQEEEPETGAPQQLRSIESNSNPNKNEKIKRLLAHEPFLVIWKQLLTKWTDKTDDEKQVELDNLTKFSLGEATALARYALEHGWRHSVYRDSSKGILKQYHLEHPAAQLIINPPSPPAPEPSPEELEQKNQEALLSLARQLFEEVRKTGRIHTGYALPVANVFDYLILIGAIAASPGRLKDIEQMGTDKENYVANRKFLEDIFAEMIAAGNELTIPSKEG